MTMQTGNLDERIRIAVRTEWPDLEDSDIDSIGVDLDRLVAVLCERRGYDSARAHSEARGAFSAALTPTHGANAGWVEIFAEHDRILLGRGHLVVFGASPDTTGHDMSGTITSIRLHDRTEPLPGGTYVIRFEENGETRRVATAIGQGIVADDSIAVEFLEDGLPISIQELSAGD